ncbi:MULTISPECIES: MarR family winged helix-turn-helix transcriptional regulator [Thermus]|uniref:MarR family transcriptional regulator n=2 Tax=Thermus TaxID=270 RepID=H7GGB0_9DEIN|nr:MULTISPECIES: MarR family transcriptional regulator [Thermus]AEG33424.1 regulatory protein MarR [Thermus thermophilus SG0.5JP17-16]EIA39072.1 MarR family transcriptional regulator [Thermus parvatiensis]NHK38300.1 MarR family transcriptional regulator [Thermus thermophilus]
MDWELLARFFRLQRLLRQEVEARLGPLGLSGLEAWLLKVLSQRPYPSEAARAMGLPPPTVSHMVRRLERAGFLAREVDPEDLRRHRLRLTPKGARALRRAEALMAEAFARRASRLQEGERAELLRLFAKLEEDAE